MSIGWNNVNRNHAFGPLPGQPDEDDQDPSEAPEAPLDEPRPPRVQDPPPQPGHQGPYVVHSIDNFTEA
jgi:hypothetical protein